MEERRILYSPPEGAPKLICSLREDEFSLPQFRIWDDGSVYRAYYMPSEGRVVREFDPPGSLDVGR